MSRNLIALVRAEKADRAQRAVFQSLMGFGGFRYVFGFGSFGKAPVGPVPVNQWGRRLV